jgi:hypothetical protein
MGGLLVVVKGWPLARPWRASPLHYSLEIVE